MITIKDIGNSKHTVELLKDEKGLDPVWIVRLHEKTIVGLKTIEQSGDSEDFYTEAEGLAHFRNVCLKVGINVPYEAPVFEDTATADGGIHDIYERYSTLFASSKVGSDHATAIRDQMMNDPDVVENVDYVMSSIPKDSHFWIHAIMRVACRRIMAREQKTAVDRYENNAKFGAF